MPRSENRRRRSTPTAAPARVDLDHALDVALRVTREAGRIALRHFRDPALAIERKGDDSPVSAADRAADAAIRRGLARAFPGHGIVTEEGAPIAGDGRHAWIVDPVDGTLSFIRGAPLWSVLVGLEIDGRVELGVMALPALRTTLWAARGRGAWENGRRLHVSERRWRDAWIVHGQSARFFRTGKGRAFRDLGRSAWVFTGSFHSPVWAAVARGQIEGFCEIGAEVWDRAAPSVIVEEAGGVFTNLRGERTHRGPGAIAAAPAAHRRILAALRPRSPRP